MDSKINRTEKTATMHYAKACCKTQAIYREVRRQHNDLGESLLKWNRQACFGNKKINHPFIVIYFLHQFYNGRGQAFIYLFMCTLSDSERHLYPFPIVSKLILASKFRVFLQKRKLFHSNTFPLLNGTYLVSILTMISTYFPY